MTLLSLDTTLLRHHSPYDTTLNVSFFHVSEVATHIQAKAIYSQPYFYMCISVSTGLEHGIAVFAGIAVFTHLRRLNVITSNNNLIVLLGHH